MNKTLLPIITIIIVIAVLFITLSSSNTNKPELTASDYRNISYEIDGENIKLTNGKAETEAQIKQALKLLSK
jgi:hypothetical protein